MVDVDSKDQASNILPFSVDLHLHPNNRYVGTELLLRTDLYNGQLCESTGEKYSFVEVIGYYECIHTTGN